jgi:hypothetical protein
MIVYGSEKLLNDLENHQRMHAQTVLIKMFRTLKNPSPDTVPLKKCSIFSAWLLFWNEKDLAFHKIHDCTSEQYSNGMKTAAEHVLSQWIFFAKKNFTSKISCRQKIKSTKPSNLYLEQMSLVFWRRFFVRPQTFYSRVL